ncbi:sensor histidine kinase [Yunchengibacter salinarum]|uniref:sensor histidine kinase n=1 Tax=Yunchengibacter salinarum TaxID=3133399 RepID=UPI0035B637BD
MDSEVATPALWIAMALAGAVWVALTLAALMRAARLSRTNKRLADLAALFDTLLESDPRAPLWLWQTGAVQAPAVTRRLLGLPDDPPDLDHLVQGRMGGGGLPEEVVEMLHQHLAGERRGTRPLMIKSGVGGESLFMDVQPLDHADPDWPAAVAWFRQDRRGAPRGGQDATMAIEQRLDDLVGVLNALPTPIWLRDRSLSLMEVNQTYVTAVEGESDEQVLRDQVELFRHAPVDSARSAFESGAPARERQYAVVSGNRRAFTVIHVPFDERRVLGVALDVTGEETALGELSRVLESHGETLDRLRTPVAIFGPRRQLRFYNGAFRRLTDLPEDWLDGEPDHGDLLEAMRERRRLPEQADFQAWKAEILDQYTRLIEPEETLWHLPDGSTFRVVSQPHPLGGLLLIFEDVTDRLALEQSVNTLIAVQRETLENMREGVAVFGMDGRLRLSNPAFADLWHLGRETLSGDPHVGSLVDALAPRLSRLGENDIFVQGLPDWVANRAPRNGRWYAGGNQVVDYSLVPLPDGGTLLTQIDITDSFRIEQALRERSRALEAADRLRSQFITNMSYELRTPLNSILGFAELLDQRLFGSLNDQQADYVRDIIASASQLQRMISDVLDLAVIESGNMTLDLDRVSPSALVAEAARLTADRVSRAGLRIRVETPRVDPPLEGDSRRLRQAMVNMIAAMLPLGQPDSEIVLSVESAEQGDYVDVRLSNLQGGLTLRERDRLIAVLEVGGTPEGRRSTGIDLALVRSIVNLHGGTMLLEPVDTAGLAIRMRLPARPKKLEKAAPETV